MARSGNSQAVDEAAPAERAADDIDWQGAPTEGATGAEVEKAAVGQLVQGGPAMMSLAQWLTEKATRTDQDTWQDMERTISRILSGESAEEVLKKDLPISGKTFVDRPFLLHGFTITESDFEEGSPFYANLDVTVRAGEERHVLNVGGIKVLAKLMVLDRLGEYPYAVMLTGDTTKKGYTVLDLVMPKVGGTR